MYTEQQVEIILTRVFFNDFRCQRNRSAETELTIAVGGARLYVASIQSIEFLHVNAGKIVARKGLLCPSVINGRHVKDGDVAVLEWGTPALPVVLRGRWEVEIRLKGGQGGVRPGWPDLGTFVPQKRTRSASNAPKRQQNGSTPHLLVAHTARAHSLAEGIMETLSDV